MDCEKFTLCNSVLIIIRPDDELKMNSKTMFANYAPCQTSFAITIESMEAGSNRKEFRFVKMMESSNIHMAGGK